MAASAVPAEPFERCRLKVTGTVQGVGFRPFVYRLAAGLGLSGFVRNDSAGVLIEVEGPAWAVAELGRLLVTDAPPLARVAGVESQTLPPRGAGGGFEITASDNDGVADVPVSVDTGTCDDCLGEVDDPADRRFGYPFTNCTNCGPRYTIVTSVPYDRPATTMAGFTMCARCQAEYDDPSDRRFHAQPNACPRCGPRLRWCRPDGSDWVEGAGGAPGEVGGGAPGEVGGGAPGEVGGGGSGAALAAAASALVAGRIVAVKGIGGYHLAVDATSAPAVAELRRRKARDDKPFAVMVADLDAAGQLVDLGPETGVERAPGAGGAAGADGAGGAAGADGAGGAARGLLASPRRPIVLAPRRAGANIAPAVAPGLAELGVMLPYSALHHLLLSAVGRPLVMTSGNLSDEPIAYTDEDAIARLGPLVDGILTHDRPIHIRCDDSVVRARGRRWQVLRRSRGYAPEPLALPIPTPRPLLAVGAELKSTVAVAKGASLVASHHLGDLEHLATYRSFLQAIDHLCHLCGVTPEVVAHDLHPEYLSTKLAAELDLPSVGVQHHHAHVASCLVDHGRRGPAVGVAFDGLGYGTDGTLWGGELLVADLAGFERVGHLAPVALPGGTAAIKEPWRMAVAWAYQACGEKVAGEVGERLDGRTPQLLSLLGGGSRQPVTTSVGRLFDAVAALVVGRAVSTYEGQAAIELEARAGAVSPGAASPYPADVSARNGEVVIDPAPLVAAVIGDMAGGSDPALVAAGFHEGLAAATVAAAARVAAERGLATVALTGGVFQNARLSALVETGLGRAGLEVLVHRHIPTNDGGISIGQAAVAAAAGGG